MQFEHIREATPPPLHHRRFPEVQNLIWGVCFFLVLLDKELYTEAVLFETDKL
jgi:hypothetical protein